MARTPDERLDRYMRFRCTDQEGERLMRVAKSQSMTFSEYARQHLLPAARSGHGGGRHQAATVSRAGEGPAGATDSEAKVLAFQIQKVGVNLNQIAKAMHIHQAPPPPDLQPLLEEIRQYVRRAQRLPKGYDP
jgi:hypothetical protein